MEIVGVIEKGAGRGAYFTCLDWVVDQLEQAVGFKPFPGTLNVRIADEDLSKLDAFIEHRDCELVPDNPQFCSAGLKKVRINGIPAALILPSEDVRIHGKEIIEIVADRHIKDALGLADGDQVIITDVDLPA